MFMISKPLEHMMTMVAFKKTASYASDGKKKSYGPRQFYPMKDS